MRCCVYGCKSSAVNKNGTCRKHADKDTRICLGGCGRWFVRRSKGNGLCENCAKRNESYGCRDEHRIRW